jgi:mannose-P-dolichol utilization defect protein 1
MLAAALLAASFYALWYPTLVNDQHLAMLQAATIPVTLLSRIPQIVSNFQSKSTGQLSALTIFLYFFGSLARVFTTYVFIINSMYISKLNSTVEKVCKKSRIR